MSYAVDISRQRRDAGVSIIAFHRFDGPNTLRGFADVHIVGWHFRISVALHMPA